MRKLFVILSILFFLVIIALELYVQSDAFSARIRPFVVEPLRKALGEDARIGFVKANFIPPSLEVRDITIPGAEGRTAISIRKVTLYINPVPLLVKKVRLPAITILEPHIHVYRAEDGSFSIMPLVERIRSNLSRKENGEPAGFTLLLRSITVKKGEVWYTDEALSSQVSITDLHLTSRFNLANDRVHVTVQDGRVMATAPAYPKLEGEFKASAEYDRGHLRLASAVLTTDDATASVSGEAGPFPDPVLNLVGRIRTGPHIIGRFAGILKQKQKQQGPSVDASVKIRGKASKPDIEGDVSFSGLSYKGVTLRNAALSFTYRDRTFTVDGGKWQVQKAAKTLVVDRIAASLAYQRGVVAVRNFSLSAGDLALDIDGTLDPTQGFDLRLHALSTGEGRTIGFVTSLPIEGVVGVKGSLGGALSAPHFDGVVSAASVTVRGVQFNSVNGSMSFRDKKLSLSSLDIRRKTSKTSHYILDGFADLRAMEPAYSARLRVLQSDVVSIIALFYKPLPLDLTAKGELTFEGTSRDYSGSAYLTLDAGSAYGETFTRGVVTAMLSTGKISFPQVTVYKRQGMLKGTGWISFDGKYSADIEGGDITLASVDHLKSLPLTGAAAVAIHSSGTFTAPAAKASVQVEGLHMKQVNLGTMRGEAELRDASLRLTAGLTDETVKLSMLWQLRKPYAWSADAAFKTDGINPLFLFADKDVSDRLKVSAEGVVWARGGGLKTSAISGEVTFSHIGLALGDYRLSNEAPVTLLLDNGRLSTKGVNITGPGTHITISGAIKDFSGADIAVNGSAELPLLKILFPEVEHAAGAAEMQLTVKDGLSNPTVAGVLKISGGEVKIKDVPQKFTALNGTVTFTQDRIATDSLSGEMGGGTIGISGWAQLSGAALKEFSVKSAVDNVTVRYPEGLNSTVSGNLYFDGDASEQTLSGDILIKRARYDKRIEWKSMLVDIGRGLYQKKKADVGWIGDTQINVRFHGDENILFQNNLAQMPLDIDVFLRGTVNHPQLLGRVEARKGTVYFRKNDFKILHASADFVDPTRMNPVLDIQAETQVREYQIRLAVTGTAERAAVTLISDPALSDTDILSMLALGKKGSELMGKETTVGVGEAASFATGQFQDIFERRARSLTGLDRFQVDPYVSKSDTSVPRVTVGKELVQNKLYVTYSSNVGASVPEQVFRIEYLLDKHFSLVGERNEVGNYGGDLKFRFEFQ